MDEATQDLQQRVLKLETLTKKLVTVYNPATTQSYVKEIDLPGMLIVPMQPMINPIAVDLTAAPNTATLLDFQNTYGVLVGIKVAVKGANVTGAPLWQFQTVIDGKASSLFGPYAGVNNWGSAASNWVMWAQDGYGLGDTIGDFLYFPCHCPFQSQFQLKSVLTGSAATGELFVTAFGAYAI